MLAPEATREFEDSFVPMRLWCKDHWSTLAYIDTKLVDGFKPYKVALDAHMRAKRRTYRVMVEEHRALKGDGFVQAVCMSAGTGTILKDKRIALNHDDWDCASDMLNEGLFEGDTDKFDLGFEFKFTEKGRKLINELRDFKAAGGSFMTFVPSCLASEPATAG